MCNSLRQKRMILGKYSANAMNRRILDLVPKSKKTSII